MNGGPEKPIDGNESRGLISGRYDDVVVGVHEVFIFSPFSVPLLIRLFDFRAGGTELKPHTKR